jgi:hypothetical protein
MTRVGSQRHRKKMNFENRYIWSQFKVGENAENMMILSIQFLFLWKETGIKFLPFL